MNILLDTATFIWMISNEQRLSEKAKAVCLSEKNTLYFSTISAWEIQIKYQLKKLHLPETPEVIILGQMQKHMIRLLHIGLPDIFLLSKLKPIHKDPFDRMLICQAKANNMKILTPDPLIGQYNIKIIW